MSDDNPVVTQNPSIILDKEVIDVPLMIGELPGTPAQDTDPDEMFGGGMAKQPVPPKEALRLMLRCGALMAVSHAVAEGTAGSGYDIIPRTRGIDVDHPDRWPADVNDQFQRIQAFIQTAFHGEQDMSLRTGFYREEHDRFSIGWGGVIVHRGIKDANSDLPPPPKGLGRFEACGGKFTKPDRKPTMVPVPVGLDDGSIVWVEVPRFFRRIRYQSSGGAIMWFKEYGDWRSMDAKTGKFSSGVTHTPPTKEWAHGRYTGGALPKTAVPAVEVAHWETPFPGVYPYGVSAWHAEMTAIRSSHEHASLMLDYLKSGLHSVIVAAANRSFESGTADAAVKKIDELGRGREGLGALVLIELQPIDSKQTGYNSMFDQDRTGDRGRLVLHELHTKLPSELMNNTFSEALSTRISNAERIPGLLLGRSESYNFATAAAAWMTANRLRFRPHHMTRESFLDALLIEMGITHWRLAVRSPEWDEQEKISSVVQSIGQMGGISVNRALQLLGRAVGIETTPITEWWGDIPLVLVTKILEAEDPQAMLDALKLPGEPQIPMDRSSVSDPVSKAIDTLNAAAEEAAGSRSGDGARPPEGGTE